MCPEDNGYVLPSVTSTSDSKSRLDAKTGLWVVLAWVFVWSWQVAQGASLPAGLKDFDAYVARTLSEFEVPGVAVAIVKDGEVVMSAAPPRPSSPAFSRKREKEPAPSPDQAGGALCGAK